MLKIPTLNIKKLNEKLDEIEHLIEVEESMIKDLHRQKEECQRELEKPFEFEEKLKELLKRKNEIDTELRLDDEKPVQVVVEEQAEENEKDENEYNEYEEEDEEEDEYEL